MTAGQPMSPRDGHEQLLQVAVPPGERPLGELLRDVCALGDADIARIVALQAERELRFGEAALQLGLVQPAQLQQALARQFGYACIDPATHPHLAGCWRSSARAGAMAAAMPRPIWRPPSASWASARCWSMPTCARRGCTGCSTWPTGRTGPD